MEKVKFIPGERRYIKDGKTHDLPDEPSFFFACQSAGMHWVPEQNGWYWLTPEEVKKRESAPLPIDADRQIMFHVWNNNKE